MGNAISGEALYDSQGNVKNYVVFVFTFVFYPKDTGTLLIVFFFKGSIMIRLCFEKITLIMPK